MTAVPTLLLLQPNHSTVLARAAAAVTAQWHASSGQLSTSSHYAHSAQQEASKLTAGYAAVTQAAADIKQLRRATTGDATRCPCSPCGLL